MSYGSASADGRAGTGFIHVRGSLVHSGLAHPFERTGSVSSCGGRVRGCVSADPRPTEGLGGGKQQLPAAFTAADLGLFSSCFHFHHSDPKWSFHHSHIDHRGHKSPPPRWILCAISRSATGFNEEPICSNRHRRDQNIKLKRRLYRDHRGGRTLTWPKYCPFSICCLVLTH